MPPEFDELDPQGLPPEQAAPEGQTTPTADAAPEPEWVEIRNRAIEYEGRVEKDQFQDFADRLGLDADRLRQAIQIGLDGTRLYEDLNEERDRLRREAEAIASRETPRTPPIREPEAGKPQGPRGYATRPPEGDIPGNVYWLAETLERLEPLLERIPHIDNSLTETRERFEQERAAKDVAEERAQALRAYSDVKESWTKQGWSVPSQAELERELRRFPISDDIDLSWHEIWERVAWMMNGPAIVRRQRREAVLDTQRNKGGTISIPASGGRPGPMVPASNGADDDASLEAEAAQISSQLQGQNLMGLFGDRRGVR